MSAHNCEVKGNTQELSVGVTEASTSRITGIIENLGFELKMSFFIYKYVYILS
jgi:hypothetical protein